MSEERCEACAKTMATPASWHVLNDREREFVRDALAKHHALLAEERRKREDAEKKLAEAVGFLEDVNGPSDLGPAWMQEMRAFLASLAKKEAEP